MSQFTVKVKAEIIEMYVVDAESEEEAREKWNHWGGSDDDVHYFCQSDYLGGVILSITKDKD